MHTHQPTPKQTPNADAIIRACCTFNIDRHCCSTWHPPLRGDEPLYSHRSGGTGTVKGVSYFVCAAGHGIFTPRKKVSLTAAAVATKEAAAAAAAAAATEQARVNAEAEAAAAAEQARAAATAVAATLAAALWISVRRQVAHFDGQNPPKTACATLPRHWRREAPEELDLFFLHSEE
jgi:hypothetical protein